MNKTKNECADLIFTSPPYHDIERYESGPGQLCELKTYDEFLNRIQMCGRNCFRVMKSGAFCCWVVGDWRGGGIFRVFHRDVLNIFESVGLSPHDIVIIHNISPWGYIQAGKVAAKRYTGKIHEYLLVFRKE
jgi:site-specific DNA-methyltransferase (adenine-specific)